jgi:hypothetical protein
MPSPSFLASVPDSQALATLLANYERRIAELERKTTGLGQRIVVGGYTITTDGGNRIIAVRNSDQSAIVLADFSTT